MWGQNPLLDVMVGESITEDIRSLA